MFITVWAMKIHTLNNKKNLYLVSIRADILTISPTHEITIFTKFHTDWVKIVHFYQ